MARHPSHERHAAPSHDPAGGGESPPRGRMILRSTAVLPAMATLLNGLCGFGAIHMASRGDLGFADLGKWGDISIAAWLIFLAMVFDMLDGLLARWTRRTSDFGGQLDSLCDVISFGVAPAILMHRAVMALLRGHVERIQPVADMPMLERTVWCVAAAYVGLAALRLARFNVENEPDECAHRHFRGLPAPGAASVVAALALLFVRLKNINIGWRASPGLLAAVGMLLPAAALLAGLLMVSRFRYSHLVNQYIRGKRPFGHLVRLLVILLAAALEPFVTAAVVTIGYALSGPVGVVWRKVHGRGLPNGQLPRPSAPSDQ